MDDAQGIYLWTLMELKKAQFVVFKTINVAVYPV
jgi:hypothetical protein